MGLPETIDLPPVILVGMITAFVGGAWAARAAYSHIMDKLEQLRHEIEAVKQRNREADAEAENIRREQAAQKTTVAVMAEQITGISRTLDRIDAGMTELLRGKREG